MIRSLTDVEHVLQRSGMYTGCVQGMAELSEWQTDEKGNCFSGTWQCNQIVRKCIDELLSNAVDNAKGNNQASCIRVGTTEDCISISNDGVLWLVDTLAECGSNALVTAFGKLRSSSHYDNNDCTAGTFGIGGKVANIFSKRFEVQMVDVNGDDVAYVWEDSMSKCSTSETVGDDIGAGTIRVSMVPDEAATGPFGDLMRYVPWLRHRCLEISTHAAVELVVNGWSVQETTPDEFVQMHCHNMTAVALSSTVHAAILSNPMQDETTSISLVNAHQTPQHGVHVDQVVAAMQARMPGKRLKNELFRRVLREHTFMFVTFDVKNPVFSSQAKTRLIGGTMASTQIYDSKSVKEFFDELQDRVDVESILKVPKMVRRQSVKVEKLQDAVLAGGKRSMECTLVLTEGDSAKTFAMSGLSIIGHDLYGVFPLRGKALNAREETEQRIMANSEWKNVMTALGLQIGSASTSGLRYGHILILADADLDGVHIAALVVNFFESQFPKLLLDRPDFITMFRTPVITVSQHNTTHECFSMHEFSLIPLSTGAKIRYYKGLGSSTREEARAYFRRREELTRVCTVATSDDRNALNVMFSKKHAAARKDLIRRHIESPQHPDRASQVTARDFIHKELLFFSAYDLLRSIPNAIDGLKTSQRKVIYTAMTAKSTKVAQLASTAALKTCYLHGEQSLAECIVGLAQDFVGSNNNPLLKGTGQFGSRLQGGKDAASPRYIHVESSAFMKAAFPPADNEILRHLTEEGHTVEPSHYLPLVPLVLINGARGIATGFSTFIACHSLSGVLACVRRAVRGEPIGDLSVQYNGFTGSIYEDGTKCYTHGLMRAGKDNYVITELPVYTWTETFLAKLESAKYVQKVISRCDDMRVHIEIKTDSPSKVRKLLTSHISSSNMFLFDENGVLRRYDTAQDIIADFVKVRLEAYTVRLACQLKHLQERHTNLVNVIRFLKIMMDGNSHEYMQDPSAFLSKHDVSCGVLRIPLSDMSVQKLQQTEKALVSCEKEIEENKKARPEDVYLQELEQMDTFT